MQVDDGRIEHQSPLPFHQRGPHRGDPALPDRTIIPAVKTIPDAAGIDEVLVREILPKVVDGHNQAANFLTPSSNVTPANTSVSSSDPLSR